MKTEFTSIFLHAASAMMQPVFAGTVKLTPPSAHKGRSVLTLLLILLTTMTAWAGEVTVTEETTTWEAGNTYNVTRSLFTMSSITLSGSGTVTLNLGADKTLRISGIEVPDGVTLIINGPGSLIVKGAIGKSSSPGNIIINGGTVTAKSSTKYDGIHGNSITINGGQVTATDNSGKSAIAANSITLSWTNETDFVEVIGDKPSSKGFNSANISFANGKIFLIGETNVIATAENISSGSSCKIVAYDHTKFKGIGTAGDPFQVFTIYDLERLATNVNSGTTYQDKYFKMTADIAIPHTTAWNATESDENNFTAIGTEGCRFWGNFDGDGHTISGIRIYKNGNSDADEYQGLFGYVHGGSVCNVVLSDTRITGYESIGGIAGAFYYATASNCHVTASVAISGVMLGSNRLGGIAGFTYHCSVSGCTSAATVTSTADNSTNFGGIVGSILLEFFDTTCWLFDNISYGATVSCNTTNCGAFWGNDIDLGNTVRNNYCNYCTVNGNSQTDGYFVTLGEGVTAGTAVLTITVPEHKDLIGTDLVTVAAKTYNVFKKDQTVTLDYTGSDVPTGYRPSYSYNDGTAVHAIDGTTFTMPAANVTVSASTATADLRSTGQAVSMSYLDENGDTRTAQAIALDNTMTSLDAGWYVVNSDVTYTGTVTLDGDVKLILADGKTMTVGTTDSPISGYSISGNNLTIYGQGGATEGTLTVCSSNNNAIYSNNITINGGIVQAESKNTSYAIDASGNVTINGGQVTATGGIQGTSGITLGWGKPTDFIQATRYYGMANGVYIPNGKVFADDADNIYKGSYNFNSVPFGGTTIHPCLVLNETDGATPLITAPWNSVANAPVCFSRTFTENIASTICLPFGIDATQAAAAGKFYTFAGVNKTANPWEVIMQETAPSNLVEGALAANTPYLFMPKATGPVLFHGTAAATVSAGTTSDTEGWTFIGTYSTKLWDSSHNADEIGQVYGFAAQSYEAPNDDNDGTPDYTVAPGDFVKAAAGASIAPFRAFLQYTAGGTSARRRGAAEDDVLPSRMTVRLVDANGESTSLSEEIRVQSEEFATASGWFTLDGRKIDKPRAKGVYIHNSRMVVVK